MQWGTFNPSERRARFDAHQCISKQVHTKIVFSWRRCLLGEWVTLNRHLHGQLIAMIEFFRKCCGLTTTREPKISPAIDARHSSPHGLKYAKCPENSALMTHSSIYERMKYKLLLVRDIGDLRKHRNSHVSSRFLPEEWEIPTFEIGSFTSPYWHNLKHVFYGSCFERLHNFSLSHIEKNILFSVEFSYM